ncbi:MAG: hypothetical protein M1830_009477 [Pleopsidium flavum]|nr:MAG: hypothetical protein M1830_009477 [Pleopsidium flavum]
MLDAVQNRGPVVLAVTTALLVASSIFVILRLVSRIGIVRRISWDDYFIVLAWLIAFGFSFSICWGTSVGLGRHEVDVEPEWRSSLKKSEYAFSVLYNPALMATKTSILAFYLTLSKTEQVFRWFTLATLVVVNAAGIALTLLNIAQCHPVGAVFKDPLPSSATCTDIVTLYLSSAPVNIITDLAILFLPMPILTRMRLPRKQKIILIITFSFGVFVAIIDVVRIAYLQSASLARLQQVGTSGGTGTVAVEEDDFSWFASLSFMWSAVEVNVGIICACVPSLKPLVSRILPSLLTDKDELSEKSELRFAGTHAKNMDMDVAAAHRIPSIPDSQRKKTNPGSRGDDGDMDMLDFLTTPDTIAIITRAPTATTAATKGSRVASMTFFDFINMKKPKSMVKMSRKESYFPLALVTILFFLWGAAYGFLDVLNSQFQLVVHMSNGQSLGLHSAYFGAYFVGPLTFGRLILKKWGFKATFISGLCIYGCGTLVFWPSAVLASFPAFLVSNFIVGLGLSTLEIAANPFIALCGPPKYAEMRLNFAQGIQAIGSVVSPLLAKKVLFKKLLDAPSLIDVQWTYLGIALFVVLLAVAFYYLPIPEASDDDLEEEAERRHSVNSHDLLGVKVIYATLALGVFSQFCYVGSQEALAEVFQQYVVAVRPDSKLGPFDVQVVGHTAFAIGRFLSAFAGCIFKPRWILAFLFTGMIVTSSLAMNLTGNAGVAILVLLQFFESGVFSIIFAMCLRGLGTRTKTASAFMTAAIAGGAIFPVIMDPVQNSRGIQYSFCVLVAIYAFGATFPAYLNLVAPAKRQVDPVDSRQSANEPSTTSRRASRASSGILRRKKTPAELPTTEHVEGNDLAPWPD